MISPSSFPWYSGTESCFLCPQASKMKKQSLLDKVPSASHELQLLLSWLTPGFVVLLAMWGCSWLQGARGMPYFWLFMLPAAPNPCHGVSIRKNVSWDHAMCLSALLSRAADSGWVALLLPSHCASSPFSMASLGTRMPRERPPGGDGSAATQGCSPGSAAGFRVSALKLRKDFTTWPASPSLSEPCYLRGREFGLKMTSEVSWS